MVDADGRAKAYRPLAASARTAAVIAGLHAYEIGRLLRGPRAHGAGLDGHRRSGRARPHPGPDQAGRRRCPRGPRQSRRRCTQPRGRPRPPRARFARGRDPGDRGRPVRRCSMRSIGGWPGWPVRPKSLRLPGARIRRQSPTRSRSHGGADEPRCNDPDHRRRRGGTPLREDPAGPLLVDVREANEFEDVRAPGAVLVPMSSFAAAAGELPADRPLMLVCHLGGRSAAAAGFLIRSGRTRRGQCRRAAWTPGSGPACRSAAAPLSPARATSPPDARRRGDRRAA